jgi:hypothetical protein
MTSVSREPPASADSAVATDSLLNERDEYATSNLQDLARRQERR